MVARERPHCTENSAGQTGIEKQLDEEPKKILMPLPKGAYELEDCHLQGRHTQDEFSTGLEKQRGHTESHSLHSAVIR